VERLEGSEEAKQRLEVILRAIGGELTVAEACAELGIGKTAFFELRKRVLQASLADLEAKPKGRPPGEEPSTDEVEAERLRQENARLRTDLEIAHVREEIALAMPEVFEPAREEKKPSKPKTKTKKRKRPLKSRKKKRGW
jgi:hypothetical protein